MANLLVVDWKDQGKLSAHFMKSMCFYVQDRHLLFSF